MQAWKNGFKNDNDDDDEVLVMSVCF